MLTPKDVGIAFYEAFSRKNAEGMAALYSPLATFRDPVFETLPSSEAKDMWRMLCKRSKDIRIAYTIVASDHKTVTIDWDAYYTFAKTGKAVHNKIRAHMHVDKGFIVKHEDNFNFWRWASQAFGIVGALIGWTPFFLGKVRTEAAKSLAVFRQQS